MMIYLALCIGATIGFAACAIFVMASEDER